MYLPPLLFERLAAYRALFCEQLLASLVEDIGKATFSGLALGNDKFRQQIQQPTGQSVKPGKPGALPGRGGQPNQTTITVYSNSRPLIQ